jgi:hypothetical protein
MSESDTLTDAQRKHGQPRLMGLAVSGSMNNAFITSISALFLLALGATPFQVGLLASTQHLQRASRLLGLYLIPKLGKARLMFWGRLSSLLPNIGLVGIAFWFHSGTVAIWLAIALLTLRGLLQQTGSTAWWPLVQDNADDAALGRYLARLRMAQRGSELVLPLIVGWYLGTRPPAPHFTPLFACALLAIIFGSWMVWSISERPLTNLTEGVFHRIWQVVVYLPVRRFALYMFFYTALLSMGNTFWVVLLTDRGMPYMYFVWMTSVTALGQLTTLTYWGHLVDQYGGRSVMSMALLGIAALGFAWITLPADPFYLMVWAFAIYLIWGMLEGAHQLSRTHTMMNAVLEGYQAETYSLIMYGASFGGIIGGLVGGTIFEWITLQQNPIWEVSYLAIAQFAFIGIWALSIYLPGHREQPSLYAIIRAWGGKPE